MSESGITIICREVSKDTGTVSAYVCKKDVQGLDIRIAGIRASINPELRYYAIRTCVVDDPKSLEDVLSFLKRRQVTDEMIEQYGGIVRL